jgi:hypothetical protein
VSGCILFNGPSAAKVVEANMHTHCVCVLRIVVGEMFVCVPLISVYDRQVLNVTVFHHTRKLLNKSVVILHFILICLLTCDIHTLHA